MKIITKLKITSLALAFALTGMAGPVLAQEDEDDGTLRLENVTIINVVNVAFKTGARTRAMEIINEHFIAAREASGTPGPLYVIHYDTGKYDMTLAWKLAGGFDDLMWYRSPNRVAWFKALAELEGGEEAARALLAEYRSLVAHRHNEVGHVHNPEDGDE